MKSYQRIREMASAHLGKVQMGDKRLPDYVVDSAID